jgi:hypothetical protein
VTLTTKLPETCKYTQNRKNKGRKGGREEGGGKRERETERERQRDRERGSTNWMAESP